MSKKMGILKKTVLGAGLLATAGGGGRTPGGYACKTA